MGSRQIEQVTSSHIFSRDISEVVECDICCGIHGDSQAEGETEFLTRVLRFG